MTPEQMRSLADDLERGNARYPSEVVVNAAAALRTAADQLEAVQYIANAYRFDAETAACIVSVRLDSILTADTNSAA